MVSTFSPVVILLGIIVISSSLREDYFNCPKIDDAITEVAKVERKAAANIFGYVTLVIRIPENGGFLPEPITCIAVTDLSSGGEDGTVNIKEGGVGSNYVVIEIVSQFLRGLNYRVEVWTS